MIDSMLLNVSKGPCQKRMIEVALQQVQYACYHGVSRGSRSINSDAPGHWAFHLLAHNHNILLDPILRQERSFRVRVAASTLFRIRLPYNIPSIKFSIDPALLKHGPKGDKDAEADSKDNQENTCPRISSNRDGHPLREV